VESASSLPNQRRSNDIQHLHVTLPSKGDQRVSVILRRTNNQTIRGHCLAHNLEPSPKCSHAAQKKHSIYATSHGFQGVILVQLDQLEHGTMGYSCTLQVCVLIELTLACFFLVLEVDDKAVKREGRTHDLPIAEIIPTPEADTIAAKCIQYCTLAARLLSFLMYHHHRW
jgi:hypothetical protein